MKMKNTKKADLSIGMIIKVAIGVIVLVIIVFLVINQGQTGGRAISCPSLGGTCAERLNCGEIVREGPDVCTSGYDQVCCNPMTIRRT